MADADMTSMVGFPLTYDGDAGGPAYTAQSYRLTAGAAHAIPDGTAFGGVQGVRAGSPTPLVGMDGTTVTVSPHMGWLCPWSGAGVYEYAITKPVQVAVGSSTGSYKIAVVLADQAAGHGTGERVTVQSYSGSTDDRMIDGLVIATVTAGVASDTAPVISMDATIRAATLARLQSVKAAEGMRGLTRDGVEYRMRSGHWSPVMPTPRQRFGSKVVQWQPGTRQGVQLASPEDVQRLFGHDWDANTMTGYAMCTSDDQLDVTSCDYHAGFNARFNVLTGGLHRINWCITEWSESSNA